MTNKMLTLVDHEGNELRCVPNGDPAKYGAYLEIADEDSTVRVHLTPHRMASVATWLGGLELIGARA